MKRTTKLFTALIAAAALTACGQMADTDAVDLALHQDYGALSEADEDPDFGDADIANADDLNGDEDVAVVDSTADTDASLADVEGDTVERPVKLQIAVMWGHLRPRPATEEVTDWTGAIGIRNAGLRVLRTLRFEGQDRLLPRPSLNVVPFESKTAPHADGLLLEVVLHPRLVTHPGEPVVLAMNTNAYSDTLVLHPGMRLSRVVRVDESGNAVAYHIFRRGQDGCEEGMLAGRYTDLRETDDGRLLGQIKGKYMSFDGSIAGKLKGLYGERDNGAQVFFAKVIGRDGNFKGILAGRYGQGHLRGRYINRGRVVAGVMHGMYREAPEDQGGGFFMGRWSLNCGELSTEGEVETSDEDNSTVDAEVSE